MKMKKIIALLLAAVMLIGLAACTKTEDDGGSNTDNPSTNTDKPSNGDEGNTNGDVADSITLWVYPCLLYTSWLWMEKTFWSFAETKPLPGFRCTLWRGSFRSATKGQALL